MNTIIAKTLGNLAWALFALALLMILSISGFSLWAEGRLTDTACYLIMAGITIATYKLWRLDRAVRRGEVDESTLPFFLRNDY